MRQVITIRRATDADREAVRHLAARDSRPEPQGELELAFAGGELLAAVSLDGADAVADPFQPTGELVELLKLRVQQEGVSA